MYKCKTPTCVYFGKVMNMANSHLKEIKRKTVVVCDSCNSIIIDEE